MTNLAMLADHRKLHEYWQEYQRETGSNTDYQDWLEYLLLHRTGLLKQAEARAQRYEAALDSILKEIPNPSLPVTKEIARIAKAARKETE